MKTRKIQLALCSALLATHSPGALTQAWDLEAEDRWQFSLAPLFLWGMSIDGEATSQGQTLPLELDFKDDVLENMSTAFTFHFEARRGRWGLFAEYQLAELDPSISQVIPGRATANADITFKTQMGELGGAYAFYNSGRTRWEVIAGARWTDHDVDVDLQVSPVPPPGAPIAPTIPVSIEDGDDWLDGFIGARVFTRLGNKWLFTARGDAGTGGSDGVYNAAFQFNYRFAKWGSVLAGYRWMKYDYFSKSSGYGYNATQQGPLLGLNVLW